MGVNPQIQLAIAQIADVLYEFMPNKAHPFADQSISVEGLAHDMGIGGSYPGGSKRPAIMGLLTNVLTQAPQRFCPLLVEYVNRSLAYRSARGDPITREELDALNAAIQRVGFKIPELWDPEFLDALPRATQLAREEHLIPHINHLKAELLSLDAMNPQQRGFAFEKLLADLFTAFDLAPRGSFRIVGEQIDGSFSLDSDTYLLEAKWVNAPVGPGPLREFRDKVEAKATWARGLFVSWSGFSPAGLEAFSRGRSTNVIGMTGQDLFFVLEGVIPLDEVLRRKVRSAAETGAFLSTVQEMNLK